MTGDLGLEAGTPLWLVFVRRLQLTLTWQGPQHQQSTNQQSYFNIRSSKCFLNQIKPMDNKKRAKKDIRNTPDYASFRYV